MKPDTTAPRPDRGTENIRHSQDWLRIIGDHPDDSPIPSPKRENRTHLVVFWLIFVFMVGLMIYLNRTFEMFATKDDFGQIVYEIMLALVVSSAIAFGKTSQNLKYLAIWGGIFLIFAVGYGYRSELSDIAEKVVAELIPERGLRRQPNTASFPISSDGHFHIRVKVNGIPIRFLADTGASQIVLTPKDAKKLGFDPKKLVFDRYYETANGRIRGSSVNISSFEIGNLRLKNIGASVNEAEMRDSLLGMTFFQRLTSYEVRNNVLTLYWKQE